MSNCTCAGWPARTSRVKCRRNLQSDIGVAAANFARQFVDALHFADDAKCFRVHEAVDELPAFDGAIFVQDHHRHVFHVVIERVTERDHFDERRKKHEEQRHRIAPDDDEFLEQDGAEAAERDVFHSSRCSFVRSRVSSLKRNENIFQRRSDLVNFGLGDADLAQACSRSLRRD